MIGSDLVKEFAKVFQGMKNRYAIFFKEGRYVSMKRALELTNYQQHLEGKQSLLVYPFVEGDKVKWLAFDMDSGDDLECARRLESLLKEKFGIQSYIEVSKKKGYHVWVFFNDLIQSRLVRRFAHIILNELEFSCEVFPKQDSPGKGPGNAINLPYFKTDVERNKRVMIDENGLPIALSDFLTNLQMVEPERIAECLPEEKPEPTKRPKRKQSSSRHITVKSFPCIEKAIADGVPKGIRHNWALYLGSYYYQKGLGQDQVKLLLLDWDRRNEEPLQETASREFEQIIADSRKYKYAKPRCEEPQFAELCSKDCPRFSFRKSKVSFSDPIVEGTDSYLVKTKKGYKKITNFLLVPTKIYGLENREILEMEMKIENKPRTISMSREALRSNQLFKNVLAEGGWDVVFDETGEILKALRFHLSLEFRSLNVERVEIQKDVLSLLEHGIETKEISIADFTSSFRGAQSKIGKKIKDHVHLIPSLLLKFINSKGADFDSTYQLLKAMRGQLTVEPGIIKREGSLQRTWKIPASELETIREITVADETEADDAE